jgi:hypothetical protein
MPLVRRIFREALSGATTASALWRKATEEWGLRTPRRSRSGAKPFSRSAFYNLLTNVFYTGHFTYDGQLYKGKHEPILSMEEHQRLIGFIHRTEVQKPQRHKFPFTGMIRCGNCGCMITAEHHINRYGCRYTYYRCTKRGGYGHCTERYVEASNLNEQFLAFLKSLTPAPDIDRTCRQAASGMHLHLSEIEETRKALGRALELVRTKEAALLDLRLRELITDKEFTEKRSDLNAEVAKLESSLTTLDSAGNWFELFDEAVSFSSMAVEWFLGGSDDIKRLIVQSTGSNLTLANRKLSIEAAFPFRCMQPTATYSVRWNLLNDFRTRYLNRDKDLLERIEKIRQIRERVSAATSSAASSPGPDRAEGPVAPAPGDRRRSSPGELSFGGGP